MCAVSAMGDHYRDKFTDPTWPIQWPNTLPGTPIDTKLPIFKPNVTRDEFEELKRTVEEMKAILLKAKEYDERSNQPHCEQEEKVALLKKIAELVGVDLTEVFGK